MILGAVAAEMWAGAVAGGGGGPSGPPTAPSLAFVAGTNTVRCSWTNGDASAATEIGITNTPYNASGVYGTPVEPTAAVIAKLPTETYADVSEDGIAVNIDASTINALSEEGSLGTLKDVWVRHSLNGSRTAWVSAGNMVV